MDALDGTQYDGRQIKKKMWISLGGIGSRVNCCRHQLYLGLTSGYTAVEVGEALAAPLTLRNRLVNMHCSLNCQKHNREPRILPVNIACYRSYCVRSLHLALSRPVGLAVPLPRDAMAKQCKQFIHSRINSTININRSVPHLHGAISCQPTRIGSGSRCPRLFQRRCSRCVAGGAGGIDLWMDGNRPVSNPVLVVSVFPQIAARRAHHRLALKLSGR